jgi:alginate O-acetyltransferase complex protein AlgI
VYFHSLEYALFFPLVLLVTHLLRKHHQARIILLLIASYYFYMSWNALLILLILCSTVVDFLAGKRIYEKQSKREKLNYVIISLVANLGLLALFKYTSFVTHTINDIAGFLGLIQLVESMGGSWMLPSKLDIPLPVGISFYTFQTLSYTLDIYRGELKPEQRFSRFALFVSFFPQLVAGPIVRAKQFLPQLREQVSTQVMKYDWAILLIMIGLFKKVVIADTLGVSLVDPLFSNPSERHPFLALLGCYGFSFQIYCDFSAYSDIAIGCAALLGFKLPQNFNSPFVATSLREFWRRWHISLSTWLRDYLYISLGGSRRSRFRNYANLLITMLLGGLWHGASWTMIIWGGIHGVSLAVNRFIDERKGDAQNLKPQSRIGKILGWIVTFHIVVVAFVIFKATSFQNAWDVFAQLAAPASYAQFYNQIADTIPGIFALILAAFTHFLPKIHKTKLYYLWERIPFWGQALCITFLIMLFKYLATTTEPFIYFQF